MTTHVYTPTRVHRSLSLLAFYLSRRLFRFSSLRDPLCPVFPVLLVLTPAACIRRRRISDVGEERHSHGERETGVGARGKRRRERGWVVARRTGSRGEYRVRGVKRNGGSETRSIGEAVTMTTVTGEVLVRIRDHAYVTTP